MNWKRMLLGVVIVLVIGGGIYFAYTRFFAAEGEGETTATVEEGAANNSAANTKLGVVSAEGNIVPLRDALLSFPTGGEVVEIIAGKGAVVASGDPILQLDATDQEIALVQAQAAVEIAEAGKAERRGRAAGGADRRESGRSGLAGGAGDPGPGNSQTDRGGDPLERKRRRPGPGRRWAGLSRTGRGAARSVKLADPGR